MNSDKPASELIAALKERAKELNTLYEVEELFNKPDITLPQILQGIARAIPPGWQYPEVCEARITLGDSKFQTDGFRESPWKQSTDLVVQDETIGSIDVVYTEERPAADEGPFLKEERKLINTIGERTERRIFHERLKSVFEKGDVQRTPHQGSQSGTIIDLLKRTDPKLLGRITRKMLYNLSWSGIEEAKKMIAQLSPVGIENESDLNRPMQRRKTSDFVMMSDDIFKIAVRSFGEERVLDSIQNWIREDHSSFLMKVLEDRGAPLAQIANAIERFHHLSPHGMELTPARDKAFRVSLIARVLSDDREFVRIASRFVEINDFYKLFQRIIYPTGGHGKLGGKASGLFLAERVLQKSLQTNESLRSIKVPKTWYLSSDCILHFISYNDLDEIVEQKYREIDQVRQDYPYIVHVFKNSPFPPEILNGLSVALDDLGDSPLIVRSSSLLEDRAGSSFAGKYKSLFIANQGTKQQRLAELVDAITEVYASTFGPDAIEYRTEHGMEDLHEEMGILIQQVVGTKVGHYFIPAFSGVTFTNNEFRWSHRIRREDGLIRMVPGLGTRAVDRLTDDYPILLSPGQPNLRVNVTPDEKVWYSPRKVDVVNLKTNSFETIEVRELLKQFGNEYPSLRNVFSVVRDDRLETPSTLRVDFEKDQLIVTFEGLFQNTDFIQQIRTLLRVLQTEMQKPVDVEFAHDGADLYLLQCRPQSYSQASQPSEIPWNLPPENILFTANKFVTNGKVSDITHVVYVDPQYYADLRDREELLSVGRAVGKLNQLLPKRKFILMGPGRWGSRGDIKLGVNVTYSDINNTALLIEIAKKQKGYLPELSFGTHFFQDLVEASIRYLPLFPDEPGIVFKEKFFKSSANILTELLPKFATLSNTIHVIEITRVAPGKTLHILMNGEHDEAVGVLM